MNTIIKEHYTELAADEGKFLTQVSVENESERMFILVACTAHPEQWDEWSAEQKEAWEEEHSGDEEEM